MKKIHFNFKEKAIALALSATMVFGLTACSGDSKPAATPTPDEKSPQTITEAPQTQAPAGEETTIYIDIAASLEAVFSEIILPAFKEVHPEVTVEYNTGSSGKLLAGIEEANGIGHDLFFSAGKAQVTKLSEEDQLTKDGSIVNLLSNQLCLVKGVNTETAVTDWDNIRDAKSMALCAGSVPVGKYSRIALTTLGFLEERDDPASFTSEEIAAALGGIEIDEADDVEVAAAKAAEASCEIATIYYSDFYNHKDDLAIIAQDDGTLTGKITYPVCLVENPEATEAQAKAAADLLAFLQAEDCLKAFEQYCFIVD